MKQALMYGAGNIGRGFIGQLFSESGYEVAFLDINAEVINALNLDKQYPLMIVSDGGEQEVIVKNVRGVLADSIEAVAVEMEHCDIMAIALGVNVLPYVIKNLAEGVRRRITAKKSLDILICENLNHADSYIRELIFKHLSKEEQAGFEQYIGLVETSIGRMVPVPDESKKKGNILRVFAEGYPYLPVDKAAFKGEIPEIKGLYPYSPFSLFLERKLYMHNMSHALTAYLGYLQGFTYIYETIAIPEIKYIVYRALCSSAVALSKKYSYPLGELLGHASNLIYRFSNRELGDTIERVGKDTIRKLKTGDRFAGTLTLLKEQNIDNGFVLIGLGAALFFAPESDKSSIEVKEFVLNHSVSAAIEKYCGIKDKEIAVEGERIYQDMVYGKPFSEIAFEIEKAQNSKAVL